jgi:hypothetical protein
VVAVALVEVTLVAEVVVVSLVAVRDVMLEMEVVDAVKVVVLVVISGAQPSPGPL